MENAIAVLEFDTSKPSSNLEFKKAVQGVNAVDCLNYLEAKLQKLVAQAKFMENGSEDNLRSEVLAEALELLYEEKKAYGVGNFDVSPPPQ